jgi:trigger factor
VSDEALEAALKRVQRRHSNKEVVDRPIQEGDVVAVAGKGMALPIVSQVAEATTEDTTADEVPPKDAAAEDAATEETALEGETTGDAESSEAATEAVGAPGEETIFDTDRLELVMDKDELFPGTPFVERMLGLSVGDNTTIQFTFPDDSEDKEFAGREAVFQLSILEVSERELPDIDDELAKLEGDYETLDELKARLREDLQEYAVSEAKENLLEETVTRMLEDTTLRYPPAAIDMEIDDMVAAFKNQIARSGWDLSDYFKIQGTTEESLREDFRESAENRIRRRLVLRQFILDEQIRVEEADVDAAIALRLKRFDNPALNESLSDYYRKGAGLDAVSSEILSDKVYERMALILSGNAPDLAGWAPAENVADLEEE